MKGLKWAAVFTVWFAFAVIGTVNAAEKQVPPDLAAYGALPAVEDMSISPDGKHLAAIARINGQRQVLVTDEQRNLVTTISAGDEKVRGLTWASPRILLVAMSATVPLGPGFTTSKLEMSGVVRVSLDEDKPELVFARNTALMNGVWGNYGTRTVDGKVVQYYGGVELKRSSGHLDYTFDHGRPALFEVDLASMKTRKTANAPHEGTWRDWLMDANGKVAVTLDMRESGSWKVMGPDDSTIASGVNPQGDVSLIGFGRDGTSVVYSQEDEQAGIRHWFEVPLAGGEPKETLPDADVWAPLINPDNGRLIGYIKNEDARQFVFFDPARQREVDRVYRAFPNLDVRIVEWSKDFSRYLVHTSGNQDSGTWYLVDMVAKRADPAGYDYPVILPEQVGPISTFAYKAGDGLDLDGILTLPVGRQAKGLPAVMLPHGGPHAQDRAVFDWWAQAFASRGYAVFQPNFRGSTNRGEAFRRAGYGQWGRKMQTDISDGLAELVRQGIVDPKRVCIVGASYGGYAALAGITLQQGIYRCAVSVAGVSDLSDMYWTDYKESGGSKMLKRNLTESLGAPSTFSEVSPRKHARDATAPILLIHGKDDTVVPFKQSTAMLDALEDAHKTVELVVLREEDHWLSHEATRKQMLEATVSFVQRHNPAN